VDSQLNWLTSLAVVAVMSASGLAVALVARETAAVARAPDVGGRRRDAVALLALAASAFVLRAAVALPWPINWAQTARAELACAPYVHDRFVAMLAAPATLLAADPLRAQGWATLSLSALAVALLAVLGALWVGRSAGLIAGSIAVASPEVLHFSRTGDASLAEVFFLTLALLGTEALARRKTAVAALGAGLAWALLFHVRPETPGLVAVLVLWVAIDRRLAATARDRLVAGALAAPVVVSLVLDALSSAVAGIPAHMPYDPLGGQFWRGLAGFGWWAILHPAYHPPLVALLAAAGVAVWRGRLRWVAVATVASLAVLATGGWAVSSLTAGTFEASNLRYTLPLQTVLHLLAAIPVARLWDAGAGERRHPWARPAAVVLAGALLAGPVLHHGFIGKPAPLQVEHRFLSDHVSRVPRDARILVYGAEQLWVREQVRYRMDVAGFPLPPVPEPDDFDPADADEQGAHPACGERSGAVVTLDQASVADGPVVYFRGWHEYAPGAEMRGSPPEAFRAALLDRWVLVPIATQRVETQPETVHPDGVMEVGLYGLAARPR